MRPSPKRRTPTIVNDPWRVVISNHVSGATVVYPFRHREQAEVFFERSRRTHRLGDRAELGGASTAAGFAQS